MGYTVEKNGIYKVSKENPVIIFDDFTTASKWVDFHFKVKSSAMKMLKIKKNVCYATLRYVWHFLGTILYQPDQYARQWIGTFSKFKIFIPPLEIQQKIAHTLDNLDAFCHDLNIELPKEIDLQQKQYTYFRERIFGLLQ